MIEKIFWGIIFTIGIIAVCIYYMVIILAVGLIGWLVYESLKRPPSNTRTCIIAAYVLIIVGIGVHLYLANDDHVFLRRQPELCKRVFVKETGVYLQNLVTVAEDAGSSDLGLYFVMDGTYVDYAGTTHTVRMVRKALFEPFVREENIQLINIRKWMWMYGSKLYNEELAKHPDKFGPKPPVKYTDTTTDDLSVLADFHKTERENEEWEHYRRLRQDWQNKVADLLESSNEFQNSIEYVENRGGVIWYAVDNDIPLLGNDIELMWSWGFPYYAFPLPDSGEKKITINKANGRRMFTYE